MAQQNHIALIPLTIPQLNFTFLLASKYKNNSYSRKEKETACPCGRKSESASEGRN